VVFPAPGGVALGTVTGPGVLPNTAVVLLPPPPPPLLPPPPPPLLPPPPSMGMAQARMMPEVPVIPEADSLVLLGLGLAAVAVLGWRARRRED
jgi:hypothetical protein